MNYIEEENEKIINELLNSKKVIAGQFINYARFLELYNPYKGKMSEQEFAEILGIKYGNYYNLKNKGTNARILKDREQKTTEEEKRIILEELTNSKKVSPEQLIDYVYFLELYNPHKEKMSEQEFAEILGISYSNYGHIKNKGTNTRILKNMKFERTEEEKTQIIEELTNSKKVKPEQLIDYVYFLELYNPYKGKMSEQEFAEILGIKYGNYYNLKNKGTNARILKDREQKTTEEEKRIILEELTNSKKVSPEQLIDYVYFLELYNLHKEKMSEQEFAEILGISYGNYNNLKNKGTNVRVLKNMKFERTEEEKTQIIEDLTNSKKVKPEQLIDYVYFLELYNPYKGKMSEQEFAEILGISYSNYNSLKSKGKNARILKDREQKTIEEEKVEELIDKKEVKPGQSIDAERILGEIFREQELSPEEVCIEVLTMNVEAGLSRKEALAKTGKMLGMNPEEMLESLQKYMMEQKRVRKTISGEFVVGEGDER